MGVALPTAACVELSAWPPQLRGADAWSDGAYALLHSISRGLRGSGGDFRRRNIVLTEQRWTELTTVNREVNRDIIPQRNLGGILTEKWLVSPRSGDCHDYAITKRHDLLARGWPSRSLLLSEVVTAPGEHHLVLIVRTKDVDLVLDNLNANVRPISMTRYQWVRVESPSNPKYWSTVSAPTQLRVAMLAD